LRRGTHCSISDAVACDVLQPFGVLDPDAEGVSAYAKDYGQRDAEAQLQAIEANTVIHPYG
jgi:hypothetical protein